MARETPSSRRVAASPGAGSGTGGGTGGLAKLLVALGWVSEPQGIGLAVKASASVHRASGGRRGTIQGRRECPAVS